MSKKLEMYTAISGEVIRYPTPSKEVATFLARVIDAANKPRVTESELVDLVYGKENPILDQTILNHQGVVTRAAFNNPVFHVMTDLLSRKRVQVGTLDLEGHKARCTMTVTEAAKKLGVHPSAVRQAIYAKKLPAVKKGGMYYLDPRSVEQHHVKRPGPKSETMLEVAVGSSPKGSFRLKAPTFGRRDKVAGYVQGDVSRFQRVAVIFGPKGSLRMFILEPGEDENEVAFDKGYVRGRFDVVEKINNSRKASERWRTFTAE